MAEGDVTLGAWREGSVVTIEVGDNGPGIPERVRPQLFEAFQSAAKPGGVGLGLAIAAELMRAHGGEIRLARRGLTAPCSMSPFPTGWWSSGPAAGAQGSGRATAEGPFIGA